MKNDLYKIVLSVYARPSKAANVNAEACWGSLVVVVLCDEKEPFP